MTDRGKWQDDVEAWQVFYEDDEDPRDVFAWFDAGPHGVTALPGSTAEPRSGGTIMSSDAGYAFAQDHAGNLAPGKPPRPYTGSQVFAVLKALGYGSGQADLAMNRAMTHDSWPLSRHVVRYDGETGTYEITPRRAS